MNVIVDTQCWLWMSIAPDRLSASARQLVEARETNVMLSAASAWEIAIKHRLGKLRLPTPPSEYVPSRLRLLRTTPLSISHDHALRTGELPPHHRDPFDRLIVAQAQLEDVSLLTADRHLAQYDVDIIWA